MTDHLPECYQYEHSTQHMDSYWCDSDCEADCICDRLRDCEERVRLEYRVGLADYAAGVQAAREAVSALREEWVCQDTVGDALAAIDALKEKP